MLLFSKHRKIKISEYLDKELPVDQTLDVSESLAFDPELNSLASDFANTDKLVKNVLCETTSPPNPPKISLQSAKKTSKPQQNCFGFSPLRITAIGVIATAGITLIGLHRKGLLRRKN